MPVGLLDWPSSDGMRLSLFVLAVLMSSSAAEWWRLDPAHFTSPELGHAQFMNRYAFRDLANASLLLRFNLSADPSGLHSCYDYRLTSELPATPLRSGTFCYPKVSIIGLPKAGTSAFFHLLRIHPNTTTLCNRRSCEWFHKEFCLLVTDVRRTVLDYFDSLPSSIESDKVFTVGCVHAQENIAWRRALRGLSTLYVVLTREYSELIWSSFNYWCDPSFDPICAGTLLPKRNIRTPKLFEEGVKASVLGVQAHAPSSLLSSCSNGKRYYRSFLEGVASLGPKNLFVVASEELSSNAQAVWTKLILRLNTPAYSLTHPGIEGFSRVRVNTGARKCFNCLVDTKKAGRARRIPAAAKKLLDECWFNDCLVVAKLTGYRNYSCGLI